ncbi:unnamed protein product [Brassica napus]|uniref:(rape) hypothetical protein n=1 Tax=Brassica napus TaxID=3708 RepID=A0A816T835_BRANA|nr:unnamed protein product [Brassica napus]
MKPMIRNLRFFLCSNKVIQVALGRSASDEIRPCIFKASKLLHGVVGLHNTDTPKEEVESLFNAYENSDLCVSPFYYLLQCLLGIKLAISNSTWSADGALMTLSFTEKAWISRTLKQDFDDQLF